MSPTYHIHITGIVQGVGFRPYVCRLATERRLKGWVCNDVDGVHIEFNADSLEIAISFLNQIVLHPPENALIQKHTLVPVEPAAFVDFTIARSKKEKQPDLLLTPDIALCRNCKIELEAPENKRYRYAFTTCLNCGPRYSIVNGLPYDRENTTMAHLIMCRDCAEEYHNIYDRRHYSQTNSCPDCPVPIRLFDNEGKEVSHHSETIMSLINRFLMEGNILAVKGIGGYLLVCDATNKATVKLLRQRKQRPAKPFAVLYSDMEDVINDVFVTVEERQALESKQAPIVLCALKEKPGTGLAVDEITKGLDKLGVFLAYTPLLKLIGSDFKKPLVATSGNLSGAPIIYKDEEALRWLKEFADYTVTFDRDIVAPQDDSVVQFTQSGRRMVLRRSRGIAPNYIPNPFTFEQPVLAMGAELKSAFALSDTNNLYISQYLGDQQNYESGECYRQTLLHLQHLLKISPEHIFVDQHPRYQVSVLGRELAVLQKLPITEVQHHLAHFAAVLTENQLAEHPEKIIGVIWDGTGYGYDGQIWGGEFFTFQNKQFERTAQLRYFPHLLADKMSREPRVAALSLLHQSGEQLEAMSSYFSKEEYLYYEKLVHQNASVQTSSMGRFLDGISGILGILQKNTYEGEAAMKLEVAARSCTIPHFDFYEVRLSNGVLEWQNMVSAILEEKKCNTEIAYIARKVFVSLVRMIELVATNAGTNKIAFSGGVFQNAFLVDITEQYLATRFELFWHRQLSPNDENISFGQLAFGEITKRK